MDDVELVAARTGPCMERRAVCAICKKLLSGDLVATICHGLKNRVHVFHRACLGPEIVHCPTCNVRIDRKKVKGVYGVSFKDFAEDSEQGAENDIDGNLDEHTEREVAEIVALQKKLTELRAKHEKNLSERELHKADAQQTTEALNEKEKNKLKAYKEVQKRDAEIDQQHDNIASLNAELQQISERQAILEYMEELHRGRPEQALVYLEKVLSEMGSDSWKALTEVKRLREHYWGNEVRFRRDNDAVCRDLARLAADAVEQERAVAGLKSKLKLLQAPPPSGDTGGDSGSGQPRSKRSRIAFT